MTEVFIKEADLSRCKKYRLSLSRNSGKEGLCIFVMLNPSTADHRKDDATIRRCLAFMRREGMGKLMVVNLFTLRSKNPKDLLKAVDPVGPEADLSLQRAAVTAQNMNDAVRVIFGWGSFSGPKWFRRSMQERIDIALAEFTKRNCTVYCLGTTKDGHPKHPLYIHGDTKLKVFKPRKALI